MKVEGTLYVHEQRDKRVSATYKRSRRMPDGTWVLQGHDRYTIWLVGDAEGEVFQRGDIIDVQGALAIVEREHNGTKYQNPNINAWSAKRHVRDAPPPDQGPPPADEQAPPPDGWTADGIPF